MTGLYDDPDEEPPRDPAFARCPEKSDCMVAFMEAIGQTMFSLGCGICRCEVLGDKRTADMVRRGVTKPICGPCAAKIAASPTGGSS